MKYQKHDVYENTRSPKVGAVCGVESRLALVCYLDMLTPKGGGLVRRPGREETRNPKKWTA